MVAVFGLPPLIFVIMDKMFKIINLICLGVVGGIIFFLGIVIIEDGLYVIGMFVTIVGLLILWMGAELGGLTIDD